ncbi:MAG: hypothetical protein KUG78_05140 [Kangiellaceae bacterium]|nr:hypothetical protein [Kangiellaceae bacterium]
MFITKYLERLILLPLVILVSFSVQANNWPDMSFPKKVKINIVSEDMVFNGIPMKTWKIDTDMTLSQVTDFYREKWKSIEDSLYDEKIIDDWTYINSKQDGFVLTAKIQSYLGKTTGYMGISHMAAIRKNFVLGNNFPLPRHSTVINDIYEKDPGANNRFLLFHTQQTIATSYQFLLKKFSDRGWSAQSAAIDPQQTGAVITMNKDADQLNVIFKKQALGTQITANIVKKTIF